VVREVVALASRTALGEQAGALVLLLGQAPLEDRHGYLMHRGDGAFPCGRLVVRDGQLVIPLLGLSLPRRRTA
jgi:hypothetical protein